VFAVISAVLRYLLRMPQRTHELQSPSDATYSSALAQQFTHRIASSVEAKWPITP